MSEAVLLSHTYKPSRTTELAIEWKERLDKQGKSKVSRLLGVPGQDDELFPDWDDYIKIEKEGGAKSMQTSLVEVDGEEPAATNGVTNGEADTGDGDVE